MNALLSRLVDQRLYSIEFVADYVQLRFDNDWNDPFPRLDCFIPPTVTIGDQSYRREHVEWPHALLTMLSQTVTATSESERSGLRVELETGALTLRPLKSDIRGPEIALLKGDDDEWMVWRPGEEAFEYL